MPNIHVLIKPASGLCNMQCSYCFYHDEALNRERASYGMMEEKTLEAVIQKAIDFSHTDCTIAYQGGEPTLRGLDFFRHSISLQNQYNTKRIRIHNVIQTNGLLLDEKWAEFFHDNHFLVGISLDGIQFTHDRLRVDKEGKGTYLKVMEAIGLLKEYEVEFNLLTVVNALTAKKISRIYSFYREQDFTYLQFIPCLEPLTGEAGRQEYSLTPKAYGHFLNTLFDLWYGDLLKGRRVHIQLFEEYIRMLYGQMPGVCGMSGICSCQHVIEADGQVYPCDFYVLDQYKLGRLTEKSMEDIQNKRKELRFIEESLMVSRECTECRYYPLCRGGCRRYRQPMYCFCESNKAFFDYCLERLEKAAAIYARMGN
ncbi:MAG: anaerobic sulfatase maturase [Lachnospiraceae bacterium]